MCGNRRQASDSPAHVRRGPANSHIFVIFVNIYLFMFVHLFVHLCIRALLCMYLFSGGSCLLLYVLLSNIAAIRRRAGYSDFGRHG